LLAQDSDWSDFCARIDMTYADEFFSAPVAFVLFALLAAAVATDVTSHRIPNLLLWPTLSFALLLHMILGGVDGLMTAAGGLALGLAMLLPLYAIGAMGGGDVKLLGVVGSFLGPWGAVVAGLATMMAGAVFGIIVIVWRRVLPAHQLHAAQILSPANLVAHTTSTSHAPGRRIRDTNIPYAPAIAAGTVAALWYIGYLPRHFLG
jgi:prepilin peptidase CpaA